MKTYNRALDMLTLALDQAKKGNATVAAKMLVKASQAPDVDKALSILEASNAQAFEIQAKAIIVAKAKATAAAKLAVKSKALIRLQAAEEVEDEEYDLGDLVDDDGKEDHKMDEKADKEEESEVDDEDMGEAIATVLASLLKSKAKK